MKFVFLFEHFLNQFDTVFVKSTYVQRYLTVGRVILRGIQICSKFTIEKMLGPYHFVRPLIVLKKRRFNPSPKGSHPTKHPNVTRVNKLYEHRRLLRPKGEGVANAF